MVRFGELLEVPLRSGVTVPAANRGTGIRMLNMGELFRFPRVPNVEMARVNLDYSNADRYLLRAGDLMFARRSLTLEGAGKCSIVVEASQPTTWESSIIRARVDRSLAVPEYLFYYFQSPQGRRQIETIVEQVAAAGIRLTELRDLDVPLPSLADQRAIAEVLGALDDKIAANDRIIHLVDGLVEAQFELLAGGRGQVALAEIAVVNRSVTKPKSGGSLRYLDISSVGQGTYEFPGLLDWEEAPGRARRVLSFGDTVWSTVRPNRRSHALILDDDPLLIASTGLAVLSPKAGRVAGLYEASRREEFVAYLESVAEGSAYPAVRAERFRDAPVPDLSSDEWDGFERFALPMRKRAHAAAVESRHLAQTRDELLPLLMSGRVRVKDAEKTVEEVL